MANYTTNYNLTKPLETEKYDIKVQNGNMDKIDIAVDDLQAEFDGLEQELTTQKNDYATYKDSNSLKVAKVEKDINNYQQTMASMNVNQEAKQTASGCGVVSLPKNAANGQVSVSIFGNTETDEEGNTKSTVSVSRLKSVGKNLFDGEYGKGYLGVDYIGESLAGIDGAFKTTRWIKCMPNQNYIISGQNTSRWQFKDVVGNITYGGNFEKVTTDWNTKYFRAYFDSNGSIDVKNVQIEEGTISTPYEPYTESTQYLPNVGELRSLPNGVADEIRVSGEKAEHIKRIDDDGVAELAEPIITPIQVSGTLLSNPSGTVYVEPVVADAGIYNEGINVLHQDLPIDYIEKLSKVNFTTGLETELETSTVIINEDKKSFTHPELEDGDIVFFTYFHNVEGTQGELSLEYYDSRHVLKDTVTSKFYKIIQTVADGVLTDTLVEV